jgi:uncharacterized protein involved in exopolysaccharide biosynthesis
MSVDRSGIGRWISGDAPEWLNWTRMEQSQIFEVLRRHMWMIVTLSLIATLAGFGGSFLLQRKYTSTALVLVRPQEVLKLDSRSTTSKEFLDFPMGQSAVETPSKTYIEIIKSPALLGQLVTKLGLDSRDSKTSILADILPAAVQPMLDRFKQILKDGLSILSYGTVVPDSPFADAVKSVQDNLVLEARPETYIFSIKYTAKDPELAADVANTTAKLFIDFMEDVRRSETRYVRDRLQVQLDQSRRQLESARQRLEEFKKEHSIFLYQPEYDSKLTVIAGLQTALAKVDESLAALRAVASRNSLSTVGLVEKRASILRSLEEKQAEIIPMPGIERELKQLELAEKVALTAYEIVEKGFKEAELKDSYAAREVQLVSAAVPPHRPSGPSRYLIALASFLGALVVGIGLAFLIEYMMGKRIRSVHDVEDFVGVKVLATIPRISPEQWRRGADL